MKDPSIWVFKDERYNQVRHFEERMTNGFSVYDWWNFNSYLNWIIIQGLEKFKTGSGHPVDESIKNMDDWRAALDKMIAGFKAQERLMNDWDKETYKADQEEWQEGVALFIKFYSSLWD
jgi:hypothetical protein